MAIGPARGRAASGPAGAGLDAPSTARQLKVELVERPVASVEELRAGLRALRPGEADAFLYVSDAMVASQAELIIESARAKRLPTMFQERGSVAPKTPASIRADKQRRMAEACDLLWGPASQHTPMWLIPEKVRATGFAPSWGQCDELQRMQVR